MLSAAASGWNAELGLWSSKDPRGWVDAAHSVEFDECQWFSSKDMVISANLKIWDMSVNDYPSN